MKKRIMILGATGMIGHGLFKYLSECDAFDVFGTKRGSSDNPRIRKYVDADSFDTVIRAVASIQPDVMINCIGIIKQNPEVDDSLTAITVNSQLPHRLSMIARASKSRIIQISTDCVFDGKKGNYREADNPNADDIYGKTKALGEIMYPPHCLTIRTSLIGHELHRYKGLVEWFIDQREEVKGFTNAMFSGLTVRELGRVLSEYVIPNNQLTGLYHISSDPISKYDLLNLIKHIYGKQISIQMDNGYAINRVLNSDKFRKEVEYTSPSWECMVQEMYEDYLNETRYRKY